MRSARQVARGVSSRGLESANLGSKPLFATCCVSLFLYFLGPQFTHLKNEGNSVHCMGLLCED